MKNIKLEIIISKGMTNITGILAFNAPMQEQKCLPIFKEYTYKKSVLLIGPWKIGIKFQMCKFQVTNGWGISCEFPSEA